MKWNILFFLLLFQCLNASNKLIYESCSEAAKNDPQLSFDFCVAYLEANTKNQPTSLEELVAISVDVTMSNTTNTISKISDLLKEQKFGDYAKSCLQDCLELYSDAVSSLEDAICALKSKDFHTANVIVSAAMDDSVTCEDQFKDKKGVVSPLTKDNKDYFQLTAISLAFINMLIRH